jgi:hypothetical protein
VVAELANPYMSHGELKAVIAEKAGRTYDDTDRFYESGSAELPNIVASLQAVRITPGGDA